MKVLVSVDLEGMPHITSIKHHLSHEGSLWSEAREVMTRVVKSLVKPIIEEGFQVYVLDSHYLGINLKPEAIGKGVYLVRGYPRPSPSMVFLPKEILSGVEVAAFIGYHAGVGTKSIMSHTYAGRYIYAIRVNGVNASEYLLNALYLGERGIPVGLVAGSKELMEEVEKFTPWAERVVLKESLGYVSSISPSLEEVEELMEEAGRRMIKRRGEMEPIKWEGPLTFEVETTSMLYAEVASLLPNVEVNGRTLRYRVSNVEEGMRILELLVLAWSGTSDIVNR